VIPLLAIDHQFKLGELFGDGQHFLFLHLFVALEKGASWLVLLSAVKRVLAERSGIAGP